MVAQNMLRTKKENRSFQKNKVKLVGVHDIIECLNQVK